MRNFDKREKTNGGSRKRWRDKEPEKTTLEKEGGGKDFIFIKCMVF